MRILHIVPVLAPETGGPAVLVPSFSHALCEMGHRVSLFTLGNRAIQENGIPDLITRFRPIPGTRQLPTLQFYREVVRRLPSFDLVHLFSLWNPMVTLSAAACRRSGIPYLLCPMGMLQTKALERKAIRKKIYNLLVEHRTLSGSSGVHFFTDAEMEDSIPVAKPAYIVPCGVDPDLNRRVRRGLFRERHQLDGKKIWTFLGRLHWSKGIELQAHAFAALAVEIPELIWAVIGPDEGEWSKVSGLLQPLGLLNRVLKLGLLPHSHCLEALADSDVFVLSSRHEAHSVAMNEALALGIPVVVTESVRFEAIREFNAGFIVTGDFRRLAEAVARILQDPTLAAAMKAGALTLAAERLAWPKVARSITEVYERVIRGAHGAPAQ
ncbi:MAG: glycosyltransferase [Acidobacteria bacterium]|nr:glycosyltransferase [Acidobacteriota bacterium]